MFTGLVECMGTVRSLSPEGGFNRIGLHAPQIVRDLRHGESVSVSGACLTVVDTKGDVFYAQMMRETLAATKFGSLAIGDRVNLERALRVGDRLDGHIVLGHVDAIGNVSQIEQNPGNVKITIAVPEDLIWGIAPKGSVAVDGVSLTVVDAGRSSFSISLIPTTLGETTIGALGVNDRVNVEIDVMARYAARILQFGALAREVEAEGKAATPLTWEKLREYGWS